MPVVEEKIIYVKIVKGILLVFLAQFLDKPWNINIPNAMLLVVLLFVSK